MGQDETLGPTLGDAGLDEEALLLGEGSPQASLWGINL